MVMDSTLVTLIVALIAIVIVWKAMKGVIKTVALVGILIVAAIIVFGGGL